MTKNKRITELDLQEAYKDGLTTGRKGADSEWELTLGWVVAVLLTGIVSFSLLGYHLGETNGRECEHQKWVKTVTKSRQAEFVMDKMTGESILQWKH